MKFSDRAFRASWRAAAALIAMTSGLLGLMEFAVAPAASAHPLGNFTVNRYSGLDLSPGAARVLYVVDMAEIPTYQEMPNVDTNSDGTASAAERQAWADRTAGQLVSNVSLLVDGSPVPLRVERDQMAFQAGQAGLPILRLEATFEGSLPTASGSVEYRDRNYVGRIGWREITVRSESRVAVTSSSVGATSVSNALRSYPVDMLSSPLDVTTATFSFQPGPGTAPSDARATGGDTVGGAPIASGGSFAALVRWRLTPLVLMGSLLLAFAFGAAHAMGPGHGKTITAAYLVGAGARRGHAVAVGAAVSLMHTASVLLLGLVFLVLARSFPPDRVYPWLELATGLVALGLGAYLLRTRLRARRHGRDPWHGHSHTHGPSHGPRSLLALAVAGGILPSPTAFVVLLGAVRAHRIAYGLALIMGFSLGLAAALVVVGLLAIRARSAIARRLAGRWASLIPVGSAAVILCVGAFFATRGSVRLV
jgi:ABC-type nickel/cobalt efflux system permease component RcnA